MFEKTNQPNDGKHEDNFCFVAMSVKTCCYLTSNLLRKSLWMYSCGMFAYNDTENCQNSPNLATVKVRCSRLFSNIKQTINSGNQIRISVR